MSPLRRLTISSLIGLSGFLLALNLWGVAHSLRDEQLFAQIMHARNVEKLELKEALALIQRGNGESERNYVERLNHVVHLSTVHYWSDSKLDIGRDTPIEFRVPATNNYLLYLLSFVSNKYRRYEFASYREALERGIGLCSQRSLILVGILAEQGIRAGIVGLDGHVIARANLSDGTSLLLDPDFDVETERRLSELEQSPELVRSIYREALKREPSFLMEGVDLDFLAKVFGPEGNRIFQEGVVGYLGLRHVLIEKLSYVVIWLLPLALIGGACFLMSKKKDSDSSLEVSSLESAGGIVSADPSAS